MPTTAKTSPTAPLPGKKPEARPLKTPRWRCGSGAILAALVTVLLSLFSAPSRALDVIDITATDLPDTGNYYAILEDPDGTLQISELKERSNAAFFRPTRLDSLHLRADIPRYWLHFQLHNPSNRQAVRVLKLSPSALAKPKLICNGQEIPRLTTEQMLRPQILFELSAPPGETMDCYLQINNDRDQRLYLTLFETVEILRAAGQQLFIDALLFGATILSMLFALASAHVYQERLFYWLSAYCGILAITLATSMGYLGPGISLLPPWPGYTMTALTLINLSIELLFVLWFPIYPKERGRLWQPIIYGLVATNVVAIALNIISAGKHTTLFNTVVISINSAIFPLAAFHCYLRHYSRLILTYLLARALLSLAALVGVMAYYFQLSPEEPIYLLLSFCVVSAVLCNNVLLVARSNRRAVLRLEEKRRIAVLGEIDRAKSETLGRLTHDIRTPLSAVLGVTEMLAESRLNASQRDYVQTLQRSSHELLQTLEESGQALQFSDRETELNHEIINLAELLGDSMSSFRNMAAERSLDLIIDLDPELPANVLGDSSRLKQLLNHAMNSAFDHSTFGHILLSVHASPTRRNFLSFEFQHSGTPFSQRERQAIARSNSENNIGIMNTRFAIMGQLLSLMGGQLSLRNSGDQRHTLTFSIPFQVPSQQTTGEVDNPLLIDKSLLIVDDNKTFCEVIRKQCQNWGMRVFSAANEQAAIALVRNKQLLKAPIDIVLIDHKQPDNGLHLAQQLHSATNAIANPPICILMAFANTQISREELSSNHISRVLSKPINSTTLRSVLLGELHYNASWRPAQFHTESLQPQALHCLIAEDNPTNALVLQRMLETMGITVSHVENGQQAVSLFFREEFDVVILDIEMPVMDGIEACRQIRAFEIEEGRSRTPIFGLTANALDEQRDTYLQVGMDLHLIKPIRLWELAEALKRWTGFDNNHSNSDHPTDTDAV